VVVMSLLVSACAAPTPAPAPAPAPAPSPTPAPAPAPTPPPAEEVVTWRFQSSGQTVSASYVMHSEMADFVRKASGGRFNIEVYEQGALMGWNETLDALGAGAMEMDAMWPNQWYGRNTAFALLSAWPFGLTDQVTTLWWWGGNGMKYIDQCYAPYGVKAIPHSSTPAEIGPWSKVKYPTLESMKGATYRMGAGPAAIALQELGINVISLAAAECYGAVDRGTCDLLEYGQWQSDWELRLYEVAKFIQMPAWHQTALTGFWEISEKKWNELPEDLQQILYDACYSSGWEGLMAMNADQLNCMEKIEAEGVEVYWLNETDLATIKDACWSVMEEEADANPLYKEIWEDQKDLAKRWKKFMSYTQYETIT